MTDNDVVHDESIGNESTNEEDFQIPLVENDKRHVFVNIRIDYHPGRSFRPLDTAGICRKEPEKSPVPTGKHRKSMESGSSISAGIFSDIFRMTSDQILSEQTGARRKKVRNFSAGILLSCSADFRCFPAGTGPYPSTWVISF